MINYNVKDIALQRKKSRGFEEYRLAMSPNTVAISNGNNDLVMIDTASFLANIQTQASSSWASQSLSSSYATTVGSVLGSSVIGYVSGADYATFSGLAENADQASIAISAVSATSASYARTSSVAMTSNTTNTASISKNVIGYITETVNILSGVGAFAAGGSINITADGGVLADVNIKHGGASAINLKDSNDVTRLSVNVGGITVTGGITGSVTTASFTETSNMANTASNAYGVNPPGGAVNITSQTSANINLLSGLNAAAAVGNVHIAGSDGALGGNVGLKHGSAGSSSFKDSNDIERIVINNTGVIVTGGITGTITTASNALGMVVGNTQNVEISSVLTRNINITSGVGAITTGGSVNITANGPAGANITLKHGTNGSTSLKDVNNITRLQVTNAGITVTGGITGSTTNAISAITSSHVRGVDGDNSNSASAVYIKAGDDVDFATAGGIVIESGNNSDGAAEGVVTNIVLIAGSSSFNGNTGSIVCHGDLIVTGSIMASGHIGITKDVYYTDAASNPQTMSFVNGILISDTQ